MTAPTPAPDWIERLSELLDKSTPERRAFLMRMVDYLLSLDPTDDEIEYAFEAPTDLLAVLRILAMRTPVP